MKGKNGRKIKPVTKMGRPTNKPDDEILAFLCSKYTSKEISELYNVQPSTVRSWASRAKKEGKQYG